MCLGSNPIGPINSERHGLNALLGVQLPSESLQGLSIFSAYAFEVDLQFINSNRVSFQATIMCNLPNMASRNLAELSQNREKKMKKSEATTVKIFVPDKQLLENSI